MYIVRVIPIAKGIFRDELSFFSRVPFEAGSVVSAPIRGKMTAALVVSSRDAREERADIRNADFALKKISAENGKRVFTDAFIAAVEDTALWHSCREGAAFAALTSQVILGASGKLEEVPGAMTSVEHVNPVRARADLLVLQAERQERVRTYRNLAREAFARGASILILAPTIIEAETLMRELEHGIEERTVLLTGELPKKKLIAAWNRCVSDTGPLLIIGTAFALSVPRAALDTIIVERESARSYRGISRPFLDVRRGAEALARRQGTRFILADFPLRVETRWRADSGELEELSRAQARSSGNAEVVIADTRKKDETKELGKERGVKRTFRAISEATTKAIREELKRGGRAIVFAARRGIAPLTVCNDCGTPVTDRETGTPMVLHKSAEGNVFLSHRSGAILPAGTPCSTCGGWNLVTLGIGVERVFEELEKAFSDVPLYLFTRDTAPTHTAAKKISERFFSEKGGLLVGTERMLPYLTEPVELAAVASVDSLLSLSAWRAHEHTLSILFYLREHAELSFIIETRKPESVVMKSVESGNPAEFYRSDIEERERYQYPPFSTFIGLRARGSRQSVEKGRLLIAESFKDDDLVGPLPAVSEGKNEWSARAVIRRAKGGWPDEELSGRIRSLPPDIEVSIDPDEIV